jgi:hypothetical protein
MMNRLKDKSVTNLITRKEYRMTLEERKQKIISYGAANQQLVEALKKYPK